MSKQHLLENTVIGVLSLVLIVRAGSGLHHGDAFIDFRPMYCAGSAVAHHSDPYAVEPLRTCETTHGLNPTFGVMPAPVPGYVLAPFALLSKLPYEAVLVLWIVTAVAALIAIIVLTARMAGLSLLAPALLLFWPVAYFPINLGQLSIFGTLGIVVAAFGVHERRWSLAALGTVFSLIQPQMGLPIVVASTLFFPKSRKPLAIGIVALLALSVVALGPNGTVQYFTVELPRHAASEAYWPYQLSLTWILAYRGVPESLAVQAGSLSTIVLLFIAIFVAWRFTRRGFDEIAILSAAAFGALFGSFIHGQQMESTLPLAIILTARARVAAVVPALATALLGAAWGAPFGPLVRRAESLVQNVFLLAGVLLSLTTRRTLRAALRPYAGAVVMATLLCVFAWFLPHFDSTPRLSAADIARITASGPLASDQWKTFADLSYRGKQIGEQLIAWKIYSWLGVTLVLAYSLVASLRPTILHGPAAADSPDNSQRTLPTRDSVTPVPAFGGIPDP